MELTVEDIFPMDKGTTGSTGYELGEEIIEYKMADPKRLQWKMGMIHSHHNMKAYFSGTDMEELEDNTEFHNYYLSLVVNNAGDLVAKLAFRGTMDGYTCKDEQGEDWTLALKNRRQVMFEFDCKIKSPIIKVEKTFRERTKQIIEKSKVNTTNFNNRYHQTFKKPVLKNPFDKLNKSANNKEVWKSKEEKKPETPSLEKQTIDESFLQYVLCLGNVGAGESLEGVLESLDFIEDFPEYLSRVIDKYPELYEQYWQDCETGVEEFMQTTRDICELIEEHLMESPKLIEIQEGLERMLHKIESQISVYGY